jgi:NTP pyrophosphatase (non-canonical NTP hydrolase)
MWSDDATRVSEMRAAVAEFISARGWGRYHNPVNLASALSVEAGELLELFQWRRPDDEVPEEIVRAAGSEMADVLHFTLCLANALDAELGCDTLTMDELLEGSPPSIGGAKAAAEEVLANAALTLMAARADYGPGGVGEPAEDGSGASTIGVAIELTISSLGRCGRALGLDLAKELELKNGINEERYPVGSRPDVGY